MVMIFRASGICAIILICWACGSKEAWPKYDLYDGQHFNADDLQILSKTIDFVYEKVPGASLLREKDRPLYIFGLQMTPCKAATLWNILPEKDGMLSFVDWRSEKTLPYTHLTPPRDSCDVLNSMKGIPEEAIRSFIRRNRFICLINSIPTDKKVIFIQSKRFKDLPCRGAWWGLVQNEYADSGGFLGITLPGYSKSNDFGILYVWFVYPICEGSSTWIITFTKGVSGWEVASSEQCPWGKAPSFIKK